MKTFEGAFKHAVRRAGFKPAKSLVDRRQHQFTVLYQARDGNRYRLEDAVVAAVRNRRG